MTAATTLPHLTAFLNGLTVLFLLSGFSAIRGGHREAHRRMMLAASLTAALFLAAYLTYHLSAPIFKFPGPAALKPLYYAILVSHVFLAALAAPLALLTLYRGLAGRPGRHRSLARWTLPVWLLASISGLMVYAALYHLFPPTP